MKKVITYTYNNFNFPRKICNHIIGKEHREHHRIVVGSVIMVIGVFVAKSPIVNNLLFHIFHECVGFLIHCIGAIPIVQRIEKFGKNE